MFQKNVKKNQSSPPPFQFYGDYELSAFETEDRIKKRKGFVEKGPNGPQHPHGLKSNASSLLPVFIKPDPILSPAASSPSSTTSLSLSFSPFLHLPILTSKFNCLCFSEMDNGTVSELTWIHELVMRLGDSLHQPSQIEFSRILAQNILFSVKKAICKAKSSATTSSGDGICQYGDNQQMFKKRKMLPKWTSQVSLSTERVSDFPPNDCHSWRKYGQKDILGTKHPRAYYRCTHRKTQGCLAMKQVQRSDSNPLVFDITYRGTHTCSNLAQQTFVRSRLQDPHQSLLTQQNNRHLVSFQTNLRVKAESTVEAQDAAPLFSFPSTLVDPEEALICSPESSFLDSLSSAFTSPTTSESDCLPWSPCQKSSHSNLELELTDMISAATSVTNSPMLDVNMLKTEEMDAEFPFDTSIFFEWDTAA